MIAYKRKTKQEFILEIFSSLTVFTLCLLLFKETFGYYFFQDDWFVLNQVNLTGKNILSLFAFRTDIIYYRPVGMMLFFLISKIFFNLNYLLYHLFAFSIFFMTVFLLSLIIFKIFKNLISTLVVAFLFATASFQFSSLSWLSLTWNLIGGLFFLLTFYFYLNLREKKQLLSVLLFFLSFILALLSSEFALGLPLFIFFFEFFINPQKISFRKNLDLIIGTVFICIIYLSLRLIVFSIPAKGSYGIDLSKAPVKNLTWYFLWLFNVPEELKFQTILSKFQITENFKQGAKNLLIPLFLTLLIQSISFLFLLWKNLNKKLLKFLLLSALTFTTGLFPVLFLKEHSFSYYLLIPSFGFFFLVAHLYANTKNKRNFLAYLMLSVFPLSWLVASYLSIKITQKNSWLPQEAAISQKTIKAITNAYPQLPDASVVAFYPSNYQFEQSLMQGNALQVIYQNKNIRTIFLNEHEITHPISGILYQKVK